ncbi:protein disulfide isomerase precursor [Cryptosporidium ubiquitum]|uniref:Protein disulfide isomerase n=1 Tax=Cryptosporidium ubiquitum TaxID=857276 RepID=A0A1J4MLW0_9CRYT|nr:protein disulfide isomerase precursor [Cryptosporidium ubiquitum]OII75166.1 protein disulfide isomerase precursor [Cryptosporidium ubiquitum]
MSCRILLTLNIVLFFLYLSIVQGGNLTELNKDNFNEFITKNEHSLVIFYTDDCAACVTIIERLEKLSEELANIKVNVAKINGERNIKTLEKYQINDYPALKFFRNKIPEEYYGGREENEIIEWLKNQVVFPVSSLEKIMISKERLENLLLKNDVIYIFYGNKNSTEQDIFIDVANYNRASGKFYQILKEEIKVGLSKENFIQVFQSGVELDSIKNDSKNNDSDSWIVCLRRYENAIPFRGSLNTKKEVWDFVKANQIPLFGEISSKNYVKYSEIEYDLIWLLVPMEPGKGEESIKPYVTLFTQISQEFSQNYRVVWLDTSEHSSHLNTVLLVEPEMLPTVAVAKSRPYLLPPNTPIEYSTIKKFLHDIESNKIEPKLRSEPIPVYYENESVVKIVGNNFNSMVLEDKKNDWLIILVTPFCQPCIDTEEIIRKLHDAISFGNSESKIKFGSFDISENDLPKDEFYSNSIPSIIFFNRHNSSNPIHFDAEEISYFNIKDYMINSTSVDTNEISFIDPANATDFVVTVFSDFEQFSDEFPTQEQIEMMEKSIKHDEL